MSLGIVLRSEHGIAIGADSLVSENRIYFDPANLVSALKLPDQEVFTRDEIVAAMRSAETEVVARNHRTNKIRSCYRQNDRSWGARIKVGDDVLARFSDKVIDEIDMEAKPITFRAYINEINTRLVAALKGVTMQGHIQQPMVADFAFIGFCLETKKFEACKVRVSITKDTPSDDWKYNCVVDDCAGALYFGVGNTAIPETLIFGSSAAHDNLVRAHLRMVAQLMLKIGWNIDDDHRVTDVRRRFEEVIENAPIANLLGCSDFAECYDPTSDSVPLKQFIKLVERVTTPMLILHLKAVSTIKHCRGMSIRELLRVIQFLIETTIRYQMHIANEIPTVGGDVYYATITREEGFVFRNIEDSF